MSIDRFGEVRPGVDVEALSDVVRELASRAAEILPRRNEFDASEATGAARTLLTRWSRRHPSPGLPDPVVALSDAARFLTDMLVGDDDSDPIGDMPVLHPDESAAILLRLVEDHPDSSWVELLETRLAPALAAARIVTAPPEYRLVESLTSIPGVVPVRGAGVTLTTDAWLTGRECRWLFPGASRIIEQTIRDRDDARDEAEERSSFRAPDGYIDARTAIDIALRVGDAKARRAAA